MIEIMASTATISHGVSQLQPRRSQGKAVTASKSTVPGAKFEFITSLGPPVKARNDEESNRIVRIHAMRSFLQKRASKSLDLQAFRSVDEVTDDASKDLSSDTPATGTMGKFKLDGWKRKSRKKTELVVHDEGSEKIGENAISKDLGPFEITKVPLSPGTRRLLDHCKSTLHYSMPAQLLIPRTDHHGFTQNSFAVNPEGSFFDFAKKDTALMHALLALVATNFNLQYPQHNSITSTDGVYHQALLHQAEAIQDLNVRIGHIEAHMDDALVTAVAILANGEVSELVFSPFLCGYII
jgi:hypothetical protein